MRNTGSAATLHAKKHDIADPVRKVDGADKAAGRARYVSDQRLEGMLYVRTLRSTHARARIRSITIPEETQGCVIVGPRDVPGENIVNTVASDEPFFAVETVRFIGQPLLLVAGEDRAAILRVLAGIRVEYEDFPPILTLEDADDPSLPPLTPDKNRLIRYHIGKGDCAAAFSAAAHVVSGEYRTGYQEHVYLEPQGIRASYENGRITVTGSIQCPYYVRDALMRLFGWPEERVCVIQDVTGGGFGGKEEYPSMLAGHAALVAYKTGRPALLVYDRTEDIEVSTKRHPSIVQLSTALDETGRITGMRADIRLNAGAYAGLSQIVLQRSLFNVTNVYNIPNLAAEAACVATNTVPCGAFRGFGAPQVMFAMESHMRRIAESLGIDPLELKIRNFAKQGDRTATSGVFRSPVKLPEIIGKAIAMSDYRRRAAACPRGSFRGIGTGFFLHGCGFTGNGERDFKAKLRRRADGKAEILVATTDMGQGAKTTLSKIVAQTLGIPLAEVVMENPNTDRVVNSGPTVASRTIIVVGRLLERAARELKSRWNEPGEPEAVVQYQAPADVHWDNDHFRGEAYPDYSWGVNIVEVEVDRVTFEVTVKGVWAVYDIGRAIDERIVRGQIDGGILQGLGYGIMESMESQGGRLRQRSVTDYIIPTAADFPRIESALVDNPFDNGPFGAKGIGELSLLGAAPAAVTAVANALDVEIDALPATPEQLMALYREKHGNR